MISKTSTVAAGLAVLLAQLHQVAAHGYVEQVWANDQTYWGFNEDSGKPSGSPVLVTDYLTPTYDVWSRSVSFSSSPFSFLSFFSSFSFWLLPFFSVVLAFRPTDQAY
jgi:hypothetical protein